MQKPKLEDNATAGLEFQDSSTEAALDGTVVRASFLNDNFENIFNVVENAGYTLIDDDTTQIVKALKGPYNSTYTYNTDNIATQTVNDVVLGSDGYYYEVQNDSVTGDNPVGSVTGNWVEVPFDKSGDINPLSSKDALNDNDEFVIGDSEDSYSRKKTIWSNLKSKIKDYLSIGFSSSFTLNGYIIFPTWLGGFTIQWGEITTSISGDVTITYPIGFNNALLSFSATQQAGNIVCSFSPVDASSTTQATAGAYFGQTGERAATSFQWIAIGY